MGIIVAGASRFGYFLFKTTFAEDYGESFYALIIQAFTLIDFTTSIWKMPTILRLIEAYERFIQQSMKIMETKFLLT